jgi:uroporphyrinogen decarboxylase
VSSSLDEADLEDFERYISRLEEIEHRPEDYDLANLDNWLDNLDTFFVLIGADVEYPPANKSWAKLFLEGMILRPDLIDRYLSAQMKSRYLMIDEAFKRGVDGVLGGNDWASSTGPLISPKHFRRFILPHFHQLVHLCHVNGKVMVKHTDGDIRRIESILLDESGIDGWHPVDPTVGLTISDYKQRYGKQITLIGNVNCGTTLVNGTRDDVINETKAVIRAGAPGGGFVLSSSNSIHTGVNPELYQAMLDTARSFGCYPIERC